jgi:rubrerythrin
MIDKIYDLIEAMEDELEDAEEYVGHAMECPTHKSTYLNIAEDELKHFEKLSEMLKSHTNLSEDMKHYIDKKRIHMMRKHAYIKFSITKAND